MFSVTKRMQRGCPLLCANAWLRVSQLNRDVCANSARLPLAFAATGLDLRQVWTQINKVCNAGHQPITNIHAE